jgi:hypothetical protein
MTNKWKFILATAVAVGSLALAAGQAYAALTIGATSLASDGNLAVTTGTEGVVTTNGALSVGTGAFGIWANPVTVGGTSDPIIGLFSGVTPNATIDTSVGYETNAVRGRMLITASPAANTSQYGTVGQVRIKPAGAVAVNFTGSGVVAGLQGYYEESDESTTVTLTTGLHAGVNAAVETGTGYNLAAGGTLAGVMVTSRFQGTLTGSKYAGVFIRNENTAFKYGLYMDTSSASTADIYLQNGATIGNVANGTLALTAATTAVSAALTVGSSLVVTATSTSATSTVTGAMIVPAHSATLANGADATATCNAANKGAIVIDAANIFFGCDGTNWERLSN